MRKIKTKIPSHRLKIKEKKKKKKILIEKKQRKTMKMVK